ncbi:MAG: transport system, NAD-binding component [Bacillota bacterium]|nr:transport system, NAD-binding component [Bacillota bacterium]
MSTLVTDAQIGDCTKEDVLKALGVSNFDICFVTIGDTFQSSLEITSLLKDLGAKYVISKASRDIQAKFLLRNGADEVVYPDKDMAEKLAVRCSCSTLQRRQYFRLLFNN